MSALETENSTKLFGNEVLWTEKVGYDTVEFLLLTVVSVCLLNRKKCLVFYVFGRRERDVLERRGSFVVR